MDCHNECLCKNGGECDHVTGHCMCAHGYWGEICDLECAKHRYGKGCKKVCNCTWSNTEKCEPTDGRCLCFSGMLLHLMFFHAMFNMFVNKLLVSIIVDRKT